MSVIGNLIRAGIVSNGEAIEFSKGDLKLKGYSRTPGSTAVTSIFRDESNNLLFCTGTTVPGAEAGFSKGCIFIKTDAATGVQSIYENIGTTTSASFNLLGAISAGEITLAEGSILLGNASSVAAALAAGTSGRILVGDGTTLASVAMSGDATLAAGGALTIAAGAVDEAMLAVHNVDGLHAKRIARATYDFAEHGGAISTIGLGVTIPDNSYITRSWLEVITTLTSATDAATVAIELPTDATNGIVSAVAISNGGNPWDAGLHEGIQDGAVANYTTKTTGAREISATIAVEAVTAGKFIVFCEYATTE